MNLAGNEEHLQNGVTGEGEMIFYYRISCFKILQLCVSSKISKNLPPLRCPIGKREGKILIMFRMIKLSLKTEIGQPHNLSSKPGHFGTQ